MHLQGRQSGHGINMSDVCGKILGFADEFHDSQGTYTEHGKCHKDFDQSESGVTGHGLHPSPTGFDKTPPNNGRVLKQYNECGNILHGMLMQGRRYLFGRNEF